jgi:hypothetical protein
MLVDGGTYNGQTVTGIGLTKAAHLFWRAQTVYLVPASGFAAAAAALEASCSDLIGATLYELSTGSGVSTVSADVIGVGDCTQLANAIDAVELRSTPTQCGFSTILDPDAPDLCGGSSPDTIHLQDWETGFGTWTFGTRAVADLPGYETPDWTVVGSLPNSRDGMATFAVNDPELGDCGADDESSVRYLQSPAIAIPGGVTTPLLAVDHWVATEPGYDGGNFRISVNGGVWSVVPGYAFDFNPYNTTLYTDGNTNPLAGESAFSGADGGTLTGSWGQSQIDLSGLAGGGDSVRFRVELGQDGCFGFFGWYVDDFHLYSCPVGPTIDVTPTSLEAGLPPDASTVKQLLIQNLGSGSLSWSLAEEPVAAVVARGGSSGTSVKHHASSGVTERLGVAASPAAAVRSVSKASPSNPGVNAVMDGSFEAGPYAGVWTESSTNFGTPICDVAACGTGTGTGPRTGSYWAWFGGFLGYEEGSLSQSVTFPISLGGATLTFFVEQIACDSANDYLEVLIDGVRVFSIDGVSPLCNSLGYTLQSVDVSAWADGGAHTLTFHSEVFSTNGGNSSFFVDDAVIEEVAGGLCSSPEDVPWLSVSPDTGSMPPGPGTTVDVSFDATGFSTGTYEATLCVTSNDAVTPLLAVPVTMEVGSSCPDSMVLDHQTITGTQTYTARVDITGGPDLTINGTSVELIAGDRVVFTNGVEVGGSLTVALDPEVCTPP